MDAPLFTARGLSWDFFGFGRGYGERKKHVKRRKVKRKGRRWFWTGVNHTTQLVFASVVAPPTVDAQACNARRLGTDCVYLVETARLLWFLRRSCLQPRSLVLVIVLLARERVANSGHWHFQWRLGRQICRLIVYAAFDYML